MSVLSFGQFLFVMVLAGARLVLIPLLLALFCGFVARKFINSAFYYVYIIFSKTLSLDYSLNLCRDQARLFLPQREL